MSHQTDASDIHQKESAFHDEWAAATDLSKIQVESAFLHPTAIENRWIMRQLPHLEGASVLEIGAGLGEASVYFAKLGAREVVAQDISPGMGELVLRLADLHGVRDRLRILTGPVETMDLGSEQFDVVYCANTIHHVTDKPGLLHSAHRALRPGGYFASWDPVAYNPVINVYRQMASNVRTPDEFPLRTADARLLQSSFSECRMRFFWLGTLLLFLKFRYLDRLDPNQVRYWKHIYTIPPEKLGWWRALEFFDRALLSLPGLRWLAWNLAFVGRR